MTCDTTGKLVLLGLGLGSGSGGRNLLTAAWPVHCGNIRETRSTLSRWKLNSSNSGALSRVFWLKIKPKDTWKHIYHLDPYPGALEISPNPRDFVGDVGLGSHCALAGTGNPPHIASLFANIITLI